MPSVDIRSEHPVEEIGVGRQVLRPEHRITIGLQIHLDLVPDAGIHMVRARQHQDTGLVGGSALLKHRACARAQISAVCFERLVTCVYCMPCLLERKAKEHVAQTSVELLRYERRISQRDKWRHMAHAVLGEDILFLEEAGLDVLRCCHDARAG